MAKYPKQLKGLREKENCGDSGFFNFEESCFFVSKDETSWKEANLKCSKGGAKLVASDINFLKKMSELKVYKFTNEKPRLKVEIKHKLII